MQEKKKNNNENEIVSIEVTMKDNNNNNNNNNDSNIESKSENGNESINTTTTTTTNTSTNTTTNTTTTTTTATKTATPKTTPKLTPTPTTTTTTTIPIITTTIGYNINNNNNNIKRDSKSTKMMNEIAEEKEESINYDDYEAKVVGVEPINSENLHEQEHENENPETPLTMVARSVSQSRESFTTHNNNNIIMNLAASKKAKEQLQYVLDEELEVEKSHNRLDKKVSFKDEKDLGRELKNRDQKIIPNKNYNDNNNSNTPSATTGASTIAAAATNINNNNNNNTDNNTNNNNTNNNNNKNKEKNVELMQEVQRVKTIGAETILEFNGKTDRFNRFINTYQEEVFTNYALVTFGDGMRSTIIILISYHVMACLTNINFVRHNSELIPNLLALALELMCFVITSQYKESPQITARAQMGCISIVLMAFIVQYIALGSVASSTFLLYYCGALLIFAFFSFLPAIHFFGVSASILIFLDAMMILRKGGAFKHNNTNTLDSVEIVVANVVIILFTIFISKELRWKERSLRLTFLDLLVIESAVAANPARESSTIGKGQALTIRATGPHPPISETDQDMVNTPKLYPGPPAIDPGIALAVNKAFPKMDKEVTIRLDQVPQISRNKSLHNSHEKNSTQTINVTPGFYPTGMTPIGHNRLSSGFLNVKPFSMRAMSQRRTTRGLANFVNRSREVNGIKELDREEEKSIFGVNYFSAFAGHMDQQEMRWVRKKQSPVIESPRPKTPEEKTITPIDPKQLLTIDELDTFVSGYQFVLNGYRNQISPWEATKSMFRCHNETANVWTEWAPTIGLAAIYIWWMIADPAFFRDQSTATKWLVAACFPAYLFRSFCSGAAHLYHCVSEEYSRLWWNIDFMSIIVQALFTSFIWVHFTLYCYPNVQIMFMLSILTLGITTAITVTQASHESGSARENMLGLFIFFTQFFLYGYHLVQVLFLHHKFPTVFTMIWGLSLSGFIIATTFRATQFPEKYFVLRELRARMGEEQYKNMMQLTRQDLEDEAWALAEKEFAEINKENKWYFRYATSHNFWHLFITLPIFSGLVGMKIYLTWRLDNQC